MAAKTMRKIHVPAYCPVEVGVQEFVKSGIEEPRKKVIVMPPIWTMDSEDKA
jgi:hypothetical protein